MCNMPDKSMKKYKPESLLPGDMWCGYNKDPWILISSKRFDNPYFPKLSTWELTWFGRRDTQQLEIIVKNWTSDSRFQLISRVGGFDE